MTKTLDFSRVWKHTCVQNLKKLIVSPMVMLRMATQKCFLLFLKLQSWFLLAVSLSEKEPRCCKKWVLFCAAGQIFLLTLGKLLPNNISQLSADWWKRVCLDKNQVRLRKLFTEEMALSRSRQYSIFTSVNFTNNFEIARKIDLFWLSLSPKKS